MLVLKLSEKWTHTSVQTVQIQISLPLEEILLRK